MTLCVCIYASTSATQTPLTKTHMLIANTAPRRYILANMRQLFTNLKCSKVISIVHLEGISHYGIHIIMLEFPVLAWSMESNHNQSHSLRS